MKKFKVGQLVKSKGNDMCVYKITKVNKESLDVCVHSPIELQGYNYNGQDKEIFVHHLGGDK